MRPSLFRAVLVMGTWLSLAVHPSRADEKSKGSPVLVLRMTSKGEVVADGREKPLSIERDLKEFLKAAHGKQKGMILVLAPDGQSRNGDVKRVAHVCSNGPFERVRIRFVEGMEFDLQRTTEKAVSSKKTVDSPIPEIHREVIERPNDFVVGIRADKQGAIGELGLVSPEGQMEAFEGKDCLTKLETQLKKIVKLPRFVLRVRGDDLLLWKHLGEVLLTARKAGLRDTSLTLDSNSEEPDLTNPDVGIDPELPLNYNVDRIKDVAVPGAVDPAAVIGVPQAGVAFDFKEKAVSLQIESEKDGKVLALVLDGKKLPSEKWQESLSARLRAIRKDNPKKTMLLLSADKQTRHEVVVSVQDISRTVGIERVQFLVDDSKEEKPLEKMTLRIDVMGRVTLEGRAQPFADDEALRTFLIENLRKLTNAGRKDQTAVSLVAHKDLKFRRVNEINESLTKLGYRNVTLRVMLDK